MSGGNIQFVRRVSRSVSWRFTSVYVSVLAMASQHLGGFFVRDPQTGELVLPTRPGGTSAVNGENKMPLLAGFPARLGTVDGKLLNVYHLSDVTDFDAMTTDDMLEAEPNKIVQLGGLREVGLNPIPFDFVEGGVNFLGEVWDRIEVAYRAPVDPMDGLGLPPGGRPKSGDGEAEEDDGQPREYGPAYSFGAVRFVDRAVVAGWVQDAIGVTLDPADDRDWSGTKLDELGIHEDVVVLEPGVEVANPQ